MTPDEETRLLALAHDHLEIAAAALTDARVGGVAHQVRDAMAGIRALQAARGEPALVPAGATPSASGAPGSAPESSS